MLSDFLNNFYLVWPVLKNTWWIILPLVLFFILKENYLGFLAIRYFTNLKWVLLEVRIPKEIAKPPLAMEQIFAGLHSAHRVFDFEEKYSQGLQQDYFSVEVAGTQGEVHFYFYVPKYYRNLIEAQVYSQYPEAEVREADDYLSGLPHNIPNEEWTIFGSEFSLSREDAYPIRTYKDFGLEDIGTREELRKVDPFSAVAENLSKLKAGEYVGIQVIIRPTGDKWKEEGKKVANKLLGREAPHKKNFFAGLVGAIHNIMGEILGSRAAAPVKKEEKKVSLEDLSPGEKEVLTAVERKIAKLGFETVLRFIYVARRDVFDLVNFSAMIAALKQFNTQNLNAFKINSHALVSGKWWNPFKDIIKSKRRALFWNHYRGRTPFVDLPYDLRHLVWEPILKSKPFIFNVEELATIYHYPGETVGAPLMPRIQAKRSEPPVGLPTG